MSTSTAIGVDAGGSSTSVLLARPDGTAGKARGGSANPSVCGIDVAAQTIAATIRAAAGEADGAALFVGAAGAARESVARALEQRLREALPHLGCVHVEDDTAIALRSAIPSGPGIVLIAGTGSVAYAEHDARRVRIGGCGYLLGDEGSAFAIGLAAVRLLARVFDGRARPDETTELVQRALGVTTRDALITTIYDPPRADVARIAGLAPSIVAFAGKGNRAATKIVQGAAQDLGDLVRAAAQQAGLLERSPSVAFAGGLLRENSLLTYVLQGRLTADLPGVAIVRSQAEPVEAALRFAQALEFV